MLLLFRHRTISPVVQEVREAPSHYWLQIPPSTRNGDEVRLVAESFPLLITPSGSTVTKYTGFNDQLNRYCTPVLSMRFYNYEKTRSLIRHKVVNYDSTKSRKIKTHDVNLDCEVRCYN